MVSGGSSALWPSGNSFHNAILSILAFFNNQYTWMLYSQTSRVISTG